MEEEAHMSAPTVKNRPFILGITGGIASGKTTVTSYLKSKNIFVIDSDQIVHDLYEFDKSMREEIENLLHIDLNMQDYKKEIARIIFNNDSLRLNLNQIIHPRVYQMIERLIALNSHERLIVLDIPLLFETRMQNLCDLISVVYVSKQIQIKRLMLRNQMKEHDARLRIDSQMPLDEKRKLAHYVLDNQKDLKHLYDQVDHMLERIYYEIERPHQN